MNYSTTLFSGLVILFIAACDTQDQFVPEEKITESQTEEKKSTELDMPTSDVSVQESSMSHSSRPPLNLSIDDITLQDQTDDMDRLFNDHDGTEKNSKLFDELNRKQPASSFSLSGELLTDENEYETKDLLKSVDGIHIKVQDSFD